jgi:PmbA protein
VEGYYDNRLATVEYREIVDRLLGATRLINERDKRVKPTRGMMTLATSTVAVANGYNESVEREETGMIVELKAKAAESGMESTGNEHQEARSWNEVDFESLAARAGDKAVRFLKAKSMPGVKTDLVVRNQIFANLLSIFIGPTVSAEWVQKGRSPLDRKLGSTIASENVNIIDDGTMSGGWGTCPFDDEVVDPRLGKDLPRTGGTSNRRES